MSESSVPSAQSTNPPSRPPRRRPIWVTILLVIVGIMLVAFIAIQLIPVNRANPPVTTQMTWDSQQTKDLAYRACMDCHSNETVWPVYSYVAPASWLVYYDVERARGELNLSTYTPGSGGRQPGESLRQRSGDWAYQIGQFLAEGGQPRGGPGGDFPSPRGQRPEGQFQPPPGGQVPGEFPGGFGRFNLADQLTENIQNDKMPPANYVLMHPTARLTDDERQQLLAGLIKTLGISTQ